jgi:hypothetical protein
MSGTLFRGITRIHGRGTSPSLITRTFRKIAELAGIAAETMAGFLGWVFIFSPLITLLIVILEISWRVWLCR